MYIVAVVPRAEPPAPDSGNYVVVVRGDAGGEPIGMDSVFGAGPHLLSNCFQNHFRQS